ncbi:DoxX family protein [Nocardia nova]|uniref:DoxX family protein n=1 Tax=Nocardia nova TaxID=37330 RepID=UPI00371DCA2D
MNGVSLDLGLLLIRLALGATLCAHGLNKCRGPGGIAGTAAWFEGVGLRPGVWHAKMAVATEMGAGVLMVGGLVVPVASAIITGVMGVAALTDHRGKGFFVFKGGWEYVAVLAVMAVAVAVSGPGTWSVDYVLDWGMHGLGWGCAAVGIGGLATVAVVATIDNRAEGRAAQPVQDVD